MTKLAKNMWTNAKGERKLNCYLVNISKEVVNKADIKEEDDLDIYAKDKKIIIERKKENEMCSTS